MRIGKGRCKGTFGELIQGVLDERPFLVTLPIPNLESNATFVPNPTNDRVIGQPLKTKAICACKKLLELFDVKKGGRLHIYSNIPIGKGMSSSSADIVAAMRATADSYSLPITEEIISYIASEIEPTDGVMYEAIVAYDYINGQLIECFGSLPPFGIIGFDVGGVVDTIQFNQRPKPYDWRDQNAFLEAYELVKLGIRKKDLSLICRATTISAHINEKILKKQYINEIERLTSMCQGGVIVAHSGTVLGILFDPFIPNLNEFLLQVSRMFNKTEIVPIYYYNKFKIVPLSSF
ncbi:MAG: kinase [Bacillota bacterium]